MAKDRFSEIRKMQLMAGIIDENEYDKALNESRMGQVNEEETKMFTFKLKHDKGTITIKTSGSSLEAARKKVADSEGAPESAVELVSESEGQQASIDTIAPGRSSAEPDEEQKMYLDWVNNFLSISRFADHYGISKEEANDIINRGRERNG